MSEVTHRGSCNCGAVRFEIEGKLGPFGFCHCRTCRKASGTAFTANASVKREQVRFLGGEDAIDLRCEPTFREPESSWLPAEISMELFYSDSYLRGDGRGDVDVQGKEGVCGGAGRQFEDTTLGQLPKGDDQMALSLIHI